MFNRFLIQIGMIFLRLINVRNIYIKVYIGFLEYQNISPRVNSRNQKHSIPLCVIFLYYLKIMYPKHTKFVKLNIERYITFE